MKAAFYGLIRSYVREGVAWVRKNGNKDLKFDVLADCLLLKQLDLKKQPIKVQETLLQEMYS